MTDESKQKYKQFRNFMCNELGITKVDIEAWTKEAVADRVQKVLNGIDIEDMVRQRIERAVTGNSWTSELRSDLKKQVATAFKKQINDTLEKEILPQIKIEVTR